MKYNLEMLIEKYENDELIRYFFFWGHQPAPNGIVTKSCFSQWWYSPFVVEGVKYNTTEHWMMSQKATLFNDSDIHDRILQVQSPAEAKKLGRMVKNFDETVWIQRREEIVIKGNLHKFSQHDNFKTFLINTSERVLVEASPVDYIWGIGLPETDERAMHPTKWNGLNLLGFALMEVRDKLRNS